MADQKQRAPIDHLPSPRAGARDPGGGCPPCAWFLRCECGEAILGTVEEDAREFCRHAKACGHVVDVHVLVPVTRLSVPGVGWQWKEWTFGVKAVGEGEVVVHRLDEGHMVCGLFSGPPGSWPPGHKWSESHADVTCPGCEEKDR